MLTYNQWGIPQEAPKRSILKDFKRFWSLAALAAILSGCGGGSEPFTHPDFPNLTVCESKGIFYWCEDGHITPPSGVYIRTPWYGTTWDHIQEGRGYQYPDGTLVTIGSLEPFQEGFTVMCEIAPNYYIPRPCA